MVRLVALYVDDREPDTIVKRLKQLHSARIIDLIVERLEVGDYIIPPDIGIERKSIDDLIHSLQVGDTYPRFWNQIWDLKHNFKQPILLLEGDPMYSHNYISRVYGVLGSLLLSDIKIINVPHEHGVVAFLKQLYLHCPKKTKILPILKKKEASPREIYLAMLQTVQGIGTSIAGYIYEKYPTFKQLYEASLEEIASVKRLGFQKAKLLWRTLHGPYNVKP